MSNLSEEALFNLDNFSLFDVDEAFKNFEDWPTFYSIAKLFPIESAQNITYLTEAYRNKDWIRIKDITNNIEVCAFYVGANRLLHACKYFMTYYKAGQEALLDRLYGQLIRINSETLDEVATWLYVNRHYAEQII